MALAIDQHMRVDMNFSRCDLDLAKFLQCLPQIRVLDNFRDLVKAVWKLWMPRQMLNIGQQLQAGVRSVIISIILMQYCISNYQSAFNVNRFY